MNPGPLVWAKLAGVMGLLSLRWDLNTGPGTTEIKLASLCGVCCRYVAELTHYCPAAEKRLEIGMCLYEYISPV